METKPLLYGLIGFFIGGLVVSIAATTMTSTDQNDTMTMTQMVDSIKDKKGDDYDKAFIEEMIMHHQGAIDMARFSASNAKHQEVKDLSREIITAQEKEMADMKQWQSKWGYATSSSHSSGSHD